MPFRVIHDPSLNCILATLSGTLDRAVVGTFFTEVLRVAAESGCTRLLSDLRNARIKASTADLYWMAQALSEKSVHSLHRRAIVVARDQEDYDFWETVCSNLGHRSVRVFEDYEEAKSWAVLGDEPRDDGKAESE